MQGEKMRLERNEHLRAGRQGVESQHAQRRSAIHQHIIKRVFVGLQQITQNDFPADDPGQFHFGGSQVDIGRRDPEVVFDLAANLRAGLVVDEHIVHGRRLAVRFEAKMRRRMRLGIEIQDTDALLEPGQGSGEIDGRRGFADAPFLIDDRDASHGEILCNGPIVAHFKGTCERER